ncbi:MAG: alpha/beta hydrolase [Acidobacteria bacterium]|nr:alpha/beta hydrolase [Acidobacteriota bacterium]
MRKPLKILGISVLALAGFLGVVEILARMNIAREREKRSHLGDQLYREVSGEGDPVVLIPGLQGSTRYWADELDDLARTHRLIKVDLYGFGRSPWPLEEPDLDEHIAWLRRTLVAEDATREVTLVAHSFGGIVAAGYASRYPDEVSRLILLGAPVFNGEDEARDRIWDLSAMTAVFSLKPVLAREACMTMGAFRPVLRKILPHFAQTTRPEVMEDAVLHDWPSINGAIQNILLGEPIAQHLDGVGERTIFVHGAEDRVTSMARIQSLAEQIDASVVKIASDHQGYVDYAGRIMDLARSGRTKSEGRVKSEEW